MDGKAAFPYREDFSGKTKVVIEIEGDVVEAGADEAAEKTQLGSFEHAVGIQPAPTGFAICEPESQAHRARHEDAVPAET